MKPKKIFRCFFVLFLAIQIAFPTYIYAGTIGKFEDIRGDVSLERAKAKLKPAMNDPVLTKDLVVTGKQSRTKLTLTDDSLLNIGQNSKIEITEFLLEKNKRQGIVSIKTGALHTKVEKFLDPQSKFEVHTPTAVAGARGTEWLTVVTENPGTTIYALSQSVSVFNPAFPAQVVTVSAGNFTTVLAGAIPTVPAPFSAAALQGILNQWGLTGIQPGAAGAGAGAGAGEAGASAGAGTGAGAGAGAAAGTGVAAGVGAGTIAAGVVGAAAIASGVAAATGSSGGTTPTAHHH